MDYPKGDNLISYGVACSLEDVGHHFCRHQRSDLVPGTCQADGEESGRSTERAWVTQPGSEQGQQQGL